jgi:hypothetical protein
MTAGAAAMLKHKLSFAHMAANAAAQADANQPFGESGLSATPT